MRSLTPDLPEHVHLTFQGDPASTVTVTWQSNSLTSGDIVLYDTSPRGGNFSLYSHQVSGSHLSYAGGSGYIHTVELSGLEPDSTYYFVCGGPGAYGGEQAFKTAPDLVADVRFVVGGDSRSDPAARTLVSQAMKQADPSFVMHVGDMVNDGTQQNQWDTWFDDVNNNWVGDNGLRIPIIPCLGNHENNATNYYGQFALPGNEQWYYYDWGPNLRIIVLNSEASPSQISVNQVNWLENVLNTTPTATWTIVMVHRNVYYAGGHGNADDLIQFWVPIFDKYHVDIVFQGHDHHYHRSKPMKNNTSTSSYREGAMYVTSGGWGAPLYNYIPQSYSAYGNKTYHFTLINTYRNGTLQFEAKDVNGYTFDQVQLYKSVKSWHPVHVNGSTYDISISSNSFISSFSFNQSAKKVCFNITGASGTPSFFNVTLPKTLLGGPYTISADGSPMTVIETSNTTHNAIYAEYVHSTHKIEITGTTVIPEYPKTITTALTLIALTLTILFTRRKLLRHET